MVASLPQEAPRRPASPRRGRAAGSGARRQRQSPAEGLRLLQGSLTAQPVERQAPWLAGLHRLASGTLLGLGVSMLGLSALTLHWQNRWAQSFTDLEATKALEHRLQESAAVLEQHHLGAVRRPGQLVPTSSEKLIHLSQPRASAPRPGTPLLAGIQLRRIPAGF
ncbi:MAG: hypothetical protein ACK55X_03055 [Synechococcaceae cyanobacterium]